MYDTEKETLINKTYTCPICDKQVIAKIVKTRAAKFVDTKTDLRPIHSNVNPTKYDVVCCTNCGYAALANHFNNTTPTQRRLLRENIQANYRPRTKVDGETYTTSAAIIRLKMALLCTVTKKGKESEIGSICLKISWLYQDLADEIEDDDPDIDEKRENYMREAENAAMNAYDHLTKARMSETFPIAGMNETTLDYLLAYYAYKKGEYSAAMHLLSGVVTSRNISARLKDKSLQLKDVISEKLHENEA